jgi:hypothetical protein
MAACKIGHSGKAARFQHLTSAVEDCSVGGCGSERPGRVGYSGGEDGRLARPSPLYHETGPDMGEKKRSSSVDPLKPPGRMRINNRTIMVECCRRNARFPPGSSDTHSQMARALPVKAETYGWLSCQLYERCERCMSAAHIVNTKF